MRGGRDRTVGGPAVNRVLFGWPPNNSNAYPGGMRIWRNDADDRAAWARIGVVLTAVASVALAVALAVALVRGHLPGR